MQYFTLVILYICDVTCMSLAVTAVNMNIITATCSTDMLCMGIITVMNHTF